MNYLERLKRVYSYTVKFGYPVTSEKCRQYEVRENDFEAYLWMMLNEGAVLQLNQPELYSGRISIRELAKTRGWSQGLRGPATDVKPKRAPRRGKGCIQLEGQDAPPIPPTTSRRRGVRQDVPLRRPMPSEG